MANYDIEVVRDMHDLTLTFRCGATGRVVRVSEYEIAYANNATAVVEAILRELRIPMDQWKYAVGSMPPGVFPSRPRVLPPLRVSPAPPPVSDNLRTLEKNAREAAQRLDEAINKPKHTHGSDEDTQEILAAVALHRYLKQLVEVERGSTGNLLHQNPTLWSHNILSTYRDNVAYAAFDNKLDKNT